MNRKSLVAAAVLVTLAGAAKAQPPVPGGVGGAGNIQRPAFSPYLNLLRSGSPALNYYGLVRPEQQFRQSIGTIQGAVAANQQAIGGLENDVEGVSATGHSTQFLNYGGYFLNSQGTGGGGSGSGLYRPGLLSGGGGFGPRSLGGYGGPGGGSGAAGASVGQLRNAQQFRR